MPGTFAVPYYFSDHQQYGHASLSTNKESDKGIQPAIQLILHRLKLSTLFIIIDVEIRLFSTSLPNFSIVVVFNFIIVVALRADVKNEIKRWWPWREIFLSKFIK